MQLPKPLLIPSLKNIKKNHSEKISYTISEKNFSYVSGKWNSYISGNRTFKPKLENIKKHPHQKLNKTFLNFLAPKNLKKIFYKLDKTPLGETGCLSNLYFLLAAQGSSFLIHPSGTRGTMHLNLQPFCD